MHFRAFSAIAFGLIFPLSLASCGEMDLPSAPLDNEETSAPEASPSDNEATGPGASASDEDSSGSDAIIPPSSEAILVEAFPTPSSVWRDHVVALVTPIESANHTSEAVITLISLYDWAELPSALNESSPTLAVTIAQGYQEYDLDNWRVPTAAEAKVLKAAYTPVQSEDTPVPSSNPRLATSPFESLNALLISLEASELHLTDGTTNVRYLCEDATRTFSFAPGTTISAAGTKATTYRLRLVKTLRLKQRQ